ncbi:MAG: AEC family transporter [Clostridiales bacterium]|nr:AEC family transporter [Clostridiales bacterium]
MAATLWSSLSAVLIILAMIALGWLFGKAGWMQAAHKGFVVKFLINAALPCLIFGNTFAHISVELLQGAGKFIWVALACMFFSPALAYGVGKLLKIPHKRFGGFVAMGGFSNAMFVGYPMCHALFGDAGVPYVILFHTLNALLFWSIGSFLIHRSGDREKFSVKQAAKNLLSPPLISMFASIILVLLGVKLPAILASLFGYMGSAVTPLALLYTGFIIYETGLKNIRIDRGLTAVMVLRLVVAPLCMLGLCIVAGITGMGRGVYVIEAAMPVMTQSVIVSAYAGADENYNALGMTLTTLACLVLVPLLMLIV